MKINEENLLSLPVQAQYNEDEGEVLFHLTIGISCDNAPTQEQLWLLKKKYAEQLHHISQQLISE